MSIVIFNSDNPGHSVRNSKGNQSKLVVNDTWYKLDYLGFEAASEEFVSMLLKHSNVSNFVEYKMDDIVWNDKTFRCCSSRNFIPEKADLITVDDILTAKLGFHYDKKLENLSVKEKIESVVGYVQDYTKLDKFGQYLTALLELDAFTLNEDRHFQNITILRSPGNEYTYAPVFDNGASYCSDITMDYSMDIPLKKCVDKTKAKPFSSDFTKQMTVAQKLYGPQLQIQSDIPLVTDLLDSIKERYGTAVYARMKLIYSIQKQKYPELCVETITRFPEILQKNSIEDVSPVHTL